MNFSVILYKQYHNTINYELNDDFVFAQNTPVTHDTRVNEISNAKIMLQI